MGLYERLLGRDDAGNAKDPATGEPWGKIPLHGFNAVMGEVARGVLTNAQAQTQINAISRGGALSAGEGQEALTLLGTITSLGNATTKLARAKLIEDVLTLGELQAPAYDTPTEIKARLGV